MNKYQLELTQESYNLIVNKLNIVSYYYRNPRFSTPSQFTSERRNFQKLWPMIDVIPFQLYFLSTELSSILSKQPLRLRWRFHFIVIFSPCTKSQLCIPECHCLPSPRFINWKKKELPFRVAQSYRMDCTNCDIFPVVSTALRHSSEFPCNSLSPLPEPFPFLYILSFLFNVRGTASAETGSLGFVPRRRLNALFLVNSDAGCHAGYNIKRAESTAFFPVFHGCCFTT